MRFGSVQIATTLVTIFGALPVLAISYGPILPTQAEQQRSAIYQVADRPSPSQFLSDRLIVRFAMPAGASIRNQYINTRVLLSLLREKADKRRSIGVCAFNLQPDNQFPNLDLSVAGESMPSRVECLKTLIQYILREPVEEVAFLRARQAQIESTRTWREPDPSYPGLAEGATERLAYLAIYQEHSPQYEIQSVGTNDFLELSFDTFNDWLRRNRQENLVTFYAKSVLLQLLGLPEQDRMVLVPSISLVSARAPPGILFFGGERFGIPALVMVGLDPDTSVNSSIERRVRSRFLCNRDQRVHPDSALGAISNVTCFSHWVYGDSWLGLAVRKTDSSNYQEFCQQVRELAADADIVALSRSAAENSRGMYVLVSTKCEKRD